MIEEKYCLAKYDPSNGDSPCVNCRHTSAVHEMWFIPKDSIMKVVCHEDDCGCDMDIEVRFQYV